MLGQFWEGGVGALFSWLLVRRKGGKTASDWRLRGCGHIQRG